MKKRFKTNGYCAIAALWIASIMQAEAQTEPSPAPAIPPSTTDELAEITVTGTLIKGSAPVGTEVTTVSSADIQALGALSTQDVMASIPQITNAFNTLPFPGSGISGSTIVRPQIHNIGASGANTTLLLFDGHDMVGAGILQSTPDEGILPPIVLQSVQIVADGGSAIYGADALTGVVNIIPIKKMEGVDVDGHYGTAAEHNQWDINIAAGHEWNDSSILVSYSHRYSSELLGSDRSYFRQDLAPFGGTDGRAATCRQSNVTVNGTSYAAPSYVANTQNLCDQGLTTAIVPAETQDSFYGAFTHDFSDRVHFDTTAYYTARDTSAPASPPITSTGTITNTNPYFIPIAGATSETVQYSYAAAGGDSLPNTTAVHEWGVAPEFTVDLAGDWKLTSLFNYGRSVTRAVSPLINSAADSAALAGTTTATALDPYDIAQTNSAVLNNILDYAQYAQNTQQLEEVRVIGQGPIVELPGGSARLAVGAQYERQIENALQVNGGPYGDYSGGTTASQSVRSDSVFGELLLPVIGKDNNIPFVRELSFDLEGRFDSYDQGFGTTTNPKFGMTWSPIVDVSMRASYGTSFVAPSLTDIEGSIDSRVQYVPFSPLGPGPFNLRPTLLLAGGGEGLKPMTSSNYTVGLDYKPEWISPSSLISFTYWRTDIYKLISIYPIGSGAYFFSTFPSAYIVNPTLAQAEAEIGATHIQGPTLAQMYSNPATTPYVILNAHRTNLGNEYLKGIDFNWQFSKDVGFATLLASTSGTYVLSQISQAPDSPPVSNFTPGNNVSRLLMSASLGATVQQFTARATMNYSSGFKVDYPNQTEVNSFHPLNLTFLYDFGQVERIKSLVASINIDNVFDEQPSYENNTNTYGVGLGQTYGRLVNLGLRAKF